MYADALPFISHLHKQANQKVVETPKARERTAVEDSPMYITGKRPYRSANSPHKYALANRPTM